MIHNDVEAFDALQTRHFHYLKSIKLDRNTGDYSRYQVEIVLCKLDEGGPDELRVRCTKAFGIKIGDVQSGGGLLIDIADVRAHQLEGGAYKVTDQEEDTFSFYCAEFFAELV